MLHLVRDLKTDSDFGFHKQRKQIDKNKTKGPQLRTVSDGKINPLINPINTRGACSYKTYYYNI